MGAFFSKRLFLIFLSVQKTKCNTYPLTQKPNVKKSLCFWFYLYSYYFWIDKFVLGFGKADTTKPQDSHILLYSEFISLRRNFDLHQMLIWWNCSTLSFAHNTNKYNSEMLRCVLYSNFWVFWGVRELGILMFLHSLLMKKLFLRIKYQLFPSSATGWQISLSWYHTHLNSRQVFS